MTPTEATYVQTAHALTHTHLLPAVAREWRAGVHVADMQSHTWQPLAGLLMTLGGSRDGIGLSSIAEQEEQNPPDCIAYIQRYKTRDTTSLYFICTHRSRYLICIQAQFCAYLCMSPIETPSLPPDFSVSHTHTHSSHSSHHLNNKTKLCTHSQISSINQMTPHRSQSARQQAGLFWAWSAISCICPYAPSYTLSLWFLHNSPAGRVITAAVPRWFVAPAPPPALLL